MTTSAYFDKCNTSTKQYTNLRLHSKSPIIHDHETLPPPLFLISFRTMRKTTMQALPADATLGTGSATRCCCNSHGKEPSLYCSCRESFLTKTLSTGKETMTKSVAWWIRVKQQIKLASYLWSSRENCKTPRDPRSLSESERRIKPVALCLVLRNKFRLVSQCFLKDHCD